MRTITAMTAPFQLNDGRNSPYRLGWNTQVVGGEPVHWAYGYGDSYSALLIRIPREKVSFILLCNSGAASAPFFLGYGNLLTSPFAVNFLRSVLRNAMRDADDLYAQAFLEYHCAVVGGRSSDAAERSLKQLKAAAPDRVRRSDRSLIYLLSQLSDSSWNQEMESQVKAFDSSGDFHPDIQLAAAKFYERLGDQDQYRARLCRIADRRGYGEESATREACVSLGSALLERGQKAGRKYLWMAVDYGEIAGSSMASLDNIVAKMRH